MTTETERKSAREGAPKKIWLQDGGGLPGEPFPDNAEEVTWCSGPVETDDTGYIRIDLHEAALGNLQAKIDALMLEHCPNEMTKDQVENWGKHQRLASCLAMGKMLSGVDGCHCEACHPHTVPPIRMILCATCGNKRCPHATDHRNACTGSNAPGQKGSSYE